MTDILEFVSANGITMSAERVAINPNMRALDDVDGKWARSATHWKCLLRNRDNRQMTIYFSMGSAHQDPPTLSEVLDCLAADSVSCDAASFEEWAADLGFNSDSRKDEGLYNAVIKQADKLRLFLGEDAFEDLLYGFQSRV